MSKKFAGTWASLTEKYRIRQLLKMEKWVPTQDELERLKGKHRLWRKLHFGDFNCNHCIFNNHHCGGANKHFPFGTSDYEGGGVCHAFLMEGNYIKDSITLKATWRMTK